MLMIGVVLFVQSWVKVPMLKRIRSSLDLSWLYRNLNGWDSYDLLIRERIWFIVWYGRHPQKTFDLIESSNNGNIDFSEELFGNLPRGGLIILIKIETIYVRSCLLAEKLRLFSHARKCSNS